jgi:signal transduction histidine kinase/CHASE2 domain-containing sensor protein
VDLKHFLKVAATSLAVAVLALLLSWQTFFNQINDVAYDFTMRLAGAIAPSSPTLIVAVDEESLDRVESWPWPRGVHADLVEQIAGFEPLAIGIDFLLDDVTNEESDRALARAVQDAGNVVLATRIDETPGAVTRWRRPADVFNGSNTRLGHVHADPDLDGIIRRIVSAKQSEGDVVSALSIELLRAAGADLSEFEDQIGDSVRVRPESLMIRFSGDRQTFEHIPAWKVLEGDVDASMFRDRIVLIGVTAEGLGDDWMTPFSLDGRRMSGVEIHANALETIYSGLRIQPVPDFAVLVGLALLVLLLYGVDRRFEGRRFYAASLALIPLLIAVSWFLMSAFTLWLPFPTFLVTLGLAVPALEIRKLIRVNRDLDEKIEKLSVWAREGPTSEGVPAHVRVSLMDELEPGEDRDLWIASLQAHDQKVVESSGRRERLFGVERRNARWKLEAVDFFNEQLYRFVSFNNATLASIEDVIIVCDPAGRVVYQNPAATEMSGYMDQPFVAWDYLSGLLDDRKLMPDFGAVFAHGETRRLEFVPGSDRARFYTVTLSPISDVGAVASLHDVTAQHDLNQAKNDMVSLVSHELRTPLTSIQGYSDMLVKYGLVHEKGIEYLASIVDESHRLNQLIQSFLDIAYIESGRQKLNRTDFEVGTVLNDLLRTHGPVAAKKRMSLKTNPSGDTTIRGDRMLLYQALSNLVSNAVKYSPEGTSVILAASNGAGRVRFDVIDRGYGIPVEDRARIFEKFYRRGNAETRNETGFGLGLAFVREVAQCHGGDVSVESHEGGGSVFSLWVPN